LKDDNHANISKSQFNSDGMILQSFLFVLTCHNQNHYSPIKNIWALGYNSGRNHLS
jgi:hypothetical protein